MVKLTKIYTRTGDGGQTGLVDGSRVSKADPRMAAIGDVDEANCAIGLASAMLEEGPEREMLARIRALIHAADPDVVEEVKWRGVPVWSHDGILCTGETYKAVVKMTFPKGASLPDPAGLFNASLEGNTRRAIDIREGEEIRVPVMEEQVSVQKTPVVKEEVTVGKRVVHDTERVAGDVRKEEIRVERTGDAEIRKGGKHTPKP